MFSTVKRILRSKLNIIENFNTAEKCNQTINIDFDKKFDETQNRISSIRNSIQNIKQSGEWFSLNPLIPKYLYRILYTLHQ